MAIFTCFFAAVTFIALGVMALRFAKSGETPAGELMMGRIRHGLGFARPSVDRRSTAKRIRDIVYRGCGVTILSCVVLAALSNVLPMPVAARLPLIFSFEALAVFTFGVSWFVKGQTLLPVLKDHRPGSPVAPVRLHRACGSFTEPRLAAGAEGGGTTGPMSPSGA